MRRSMPRTRFPLPSSLWAWLFLFSLLVCDLPTLLLNTPPTVTVADASRPRCIDLRHNIGINPKSLSSAFSEFGFYFCSDGAPAQFACRCSTIDECRSRLDPFGRNVGECRCCKAWVWVLIALAVFATAVLFVVLLFCRRWRTNPFCCGFSVPLRFLAPRNRSIVVCPPGRAFPDAFFPFWDRRRFVDYYSPEYQQRIHDEEMRRCRSRSTGADVDELITRSGGGDGTGCRSVARPQQRLARLGEMTPPKERFGRLCNETSEGADDRCAAGRLGDASNACRGNKKNGERRAASTYSESPLFDRRTASPLERVDSTLALIEQQQQQQYRSGQQVPLRMRSNMLEVASQERYLEEWQDDIDQFLDSLPASDRNAPYGHM